MAVNASYRDFIVEQVEQVTDLPIRTNRMFSGVGVYAGESFFAIIMGETLYFKVGDSNRSDYEDAGMDAFRPYKNQDIATSYYEVPAEVLDDTDVLKEWVAKSITVAENAKQPKPRKAKAAKAAK